MRPGSRIETREIFLKSDKVNVAFERIEGDKIRVATSTWDDAVVLLPHQVLEIAIVGKQVGLVRSTRRWRISTSTIPAVAAGYGPEV